MKLLKITLYPILTLLGIYIGTITACYLFSLFNDKF